MVWSRDAPGANFAGYLANLTAALSGQISSRISGAFIVNFGSELFIRIRIQQNNSDLDGFTLDKTNIFKTNGTLPTYYHSSIKSQKHQMKYQCKFRFLKNFVKIIRYRTGTLYGLYLLYSKIRSAEAMESMMNSDKISDPWKNIFRLKIIRYGTSVSDPNPYSVSGSIFRIRIRIRKREEEDPGSF